MGDSRRLSGSSRPWFALATDRTLNCPGDRPRPSSPGSTTPGWCRSQAARPGLPRAGADWLAHLTALLQWLDPRIPNQVASNAADEEIAGLPLTEVRAEHKDPTTFAVMLSGDGGWAALDRSVSAELAAHGVGTSGWDSLGYYWTARSPEEAGRDLTRLLRRCPSNLDKGRVVLIGYSFGADVLPFFASRLPPDLRASVALVVLLGASPTAAFECHLERLAIGHAQRQHPAGRPGASAPRLGQATMHLRGG